MAKKKATPILTHTELLCLAYRELERDVDHWRLACAGLNEEATRLENICARQFAQMAAIRDMYKIETGTEM